MRIDPRQIPEGGLNLKGSLPVADYAIPAENIIGWTTIHCVHQTLDDWCK